MSVNTGSEPAAAAVSTAAVIPAVIPADVLAGAGAGTRARTPRAWVPYLRRPGFVLALAVAGSLAGARVHARTRATLDTAGPTFVAFLIGVIVIVGGLIYFPMLILGPIGERFIG